MNKSLLVVIYLSFIIFSIQSAPTDVNNGDTFDADIDWGCTISCGIWNGCRIIALKDGNLSNCGPQPSGCDCNRFVG